MDDKRHWGQSSQAVQGAQPRVTDVEGLGELSEAGTAPRGCSLRANRTASSPFPHPGARARPRPGVGKSSKQWPACREGKGRAPQCGDPAREEMAPGPVQPAHLIPCG